MANKLDLEEMITMHVPVTIVASPDEAPKYSPDWLPVRVDNVTIVKNGTVKGRPTVDLQLSDAAGHKYIIMMSGVALNAIGKLVGL